MIRPVRALALGAAAAVGLSFVQCLHPAVPHLAALHAAVLRGWALVRPGGQLHPAGFIESHGHLVLEGSLLLVIVWLLLQNSYKPGRKAAAPLTEKEIEELCEEWQPEPLAGELTPFQRAWVADEPTVEGGAGPRVRVRGRPTLNFASLNFLGLAGDAAIREACRATIRRYGVGSCGPRGFYGTLGPHLALEARLAAWMGGQEAILYSYDLATLPSVIPAFANKRDLIVADEGVCYAVQNGINLSRARVLWFRHNDVADLARVLAAVDAEDAAGPARPPNRRFVVVEGVYAGSGEVAPLAAIAALKAAHGYRLVVDESVALGVMGATGRGAAQAAGLAPADADIVGASLSAGLATVGGFCVGDREVVDHQRLSGLGYCFSASLPPYLAAAGLAALDALEARGPAARAAVAARARQFRALAVERLAPLGLRPVGGPESAASPLVHLRLHPEPRRDAYDAGDLALHRVARECLDRHGVLLVATKHTGLERARAPPSIRVALSAAHTEADVRAAVAALAAAAAAVLPAARA